MNAPFKLAIREESDDFIHAYIEITHGESIGNRIRIATILKRVAEDKEVFGLWKAMLTKHLEFMMKELGTEISSWAEFRPRDKN